MSEVSVSEAREARDTCRVVIRGTQIIVNCKEL
jgi:hypothetical protein